jgi:signal peptidase I
MWLRRAAGAMDLKRLLFGAHAGRTAARVFVLVAIALVTFTWILLPVRAEGISMLPTFRSGSLKFVNRLAFVRREPRRGEIVAIRLAGPNVLYIKRIVGLPGERVAIREGVVYVNDTELAEPYVRHRRAWDVPEVALGADEYFLIGDNRGMQPKDHDFGRADRSRIIGKVAF